MFPSFLKDSLRRVRGRPCEGGGGDQQPGQGAQG